jgi:hypothetical protein
VKPLPFNEDDVNRAIERLTAVLEDEFGSDLAGWGSATLVLLCSIIDMAGVDREEIVAHILKPTHYKDLQ